VLAVDLVEPVVRVAARRSKGISYVVGDAVRLPFGDAVVDQVWALGVLAHVRRLRLALGEFARVLRPGGRLAVTEGFSSSEEMPWFASRAPQPWNAITVAEVDRAIRGAGFVDARAAEWPGGLDLHPPSDRWVAADVAAGRLRPAMLLGTRP
jgi:SAM-dependent methyltransferase